MFPLWVKTTSNLKIQAVYWMRPGRRRLRICRAKSTGQLASLFMTNEVAASSSRSYFAGVACVGTGASTGVNIT